MTMQSERTQSLWQSNSNADDFSRPSLSGELTAEVVVVGAGITGLSIAYQLTRDGRQVVVIDDGDIGGGNTRRTTAHLSNLLDDRFVILRRERGKDITRIAAESHGAAIDWIERVQAEEAIDCGFRRLEGYLLLGEGDDADLLDKELEAAREAGLTAEKVPQAPAGLPPVPSLKFSNQARFDPMAYLAGLAKAFEKRGGKIFSGCHVVSVTDGDPVTIELTGGRRSK